MLMYRPVFSVKDPGRLLGFAGAALRMDALLRGDDPSPSLPMQLFLLRKDAAPELLASVGQTGSSSPPGTKFSVTRPVFAFGRMVRPVASFGGGTEYLDGIQISVNPDEPTGRGPTGTAIRDNEPFWCQDFLNDPSTAHWREFGKRYGWASDAALPLCVRGKPVGALTIYSDVVQTFDEEVTNLLVAMANDISFALDSFASEDERNRAEKARREGEARHRTILHAAMDGFCLVDEQGRIKEVNQAYCRMTGYSEQELLTMSVPDLEADMNSAVVAANIQKILEDGEARFESRQRRKDGSIFDVEVSVQYHPADRTLVSFLHDITERKRAQREIAQANEILEQRVAERTEELKRSQDQLHLALVGAQAGTWDLDFVSNLVHWSAEYYELMGLDQAKTTPTIASWLEGIHPEDRQRVEEETRRILEGRQTDFSIEFRITLPGKGERWINNIGHVTYDSAGHPLRASGLNINITRRKQAEETLREGMERMDFAFQATQDGIWDWNIETEEVLYSSRWKSMLGYQDSEVEDHVSSWKRLLHPDDLPRAIQVVEAVLRGEGEYMMEFRMLHKDGHYVDILSRGFPIRPRPDGPVTRIVGTHFDLTERRHAEEELREAKDLAESASRAKSTFLANMSHEIRTPMNAILGFSQLLLHDSGLAAPQKKHLETINRSGEHLLTLINNILDMSKIEAGRAELKPAPFDLPDLLHDLETMFRIRTDAKGLRLDVIRENDLPQCCVADKGRLLQVLINLLGNAVKFTSKGGIVLRASLERSKPLKLLFEVEDSGIGIPEELVGTLFEPFVQVHGDHQPGAGLGTGLGLAISREIALLMDGDIRVASKAGKGSIFTLTIPLVEGEMRHAQRERKLRRVIGLKPGQPAFRLLIVDDMEDNQALLTEMLSRAGFETRASSNGKDALGIYQEWCPHLVLMDMRMPSMGGVDAIRRIQTAGPYTSVKIISLTANTFENVRLEALDAGADDFLAKPFREEELFEKIRLLLGVEYEYDRKDVENVPATAGETPVFTPGELALLPADLVEQIRSAAVGADYDLLLELIRGVEPYSKNLSEVLSALVRSYSYERLLDLLD